VNRTVREPVLIPFETLAEIVLLDETAADQEVECAIDRRLPDPASRCCVTGRPTSFRYLLNSRRKGDAPLSVFTALASRLSRLQKHRVVLLHQFFELLG